MSSKFPPSLLKFAFLPKEHLLSLIDIVEVGDISHYRIMYFLGAMYSPRVVCISEKKDQACMNTGLMDDDGHMIIAIFHKNTNKIYGKTKQPFYLKEFIADYRLDLSVFKMVPKKPLVEPFDPSLSVDIKLFHVCDDNKLRLPRHVIDMNDTQRFEAIRSETDAAMREVREGRRFVDVQLYHEFIQYVLPLFVDTDPIYLTLKKRNNRYEALTCLDHSIIRYNTNVLLKKMIEGTKNDHVTPACLRLHDAMV